MTKHSFSRSFLDSSQVLAFTIFEIGIFFDACVVLISGQIYILTIYIHIGVVNSGRYDSPHILKSSLDHDSGKKIGGVN